MISARKKADGTRLWPVDKFYAGVLEQNLALNVDTSGAELLYAAGGTRVQKIRGSDGTTLWSKDISGAQLYHPTMQYDTVFVGSASGKVYAFNEATGAQKWVFQANDLGATSINLTVGKNQVAFATDKGNLYSVNVATGVQRWKASYVTPGSTGESIPGHFAPSAWMTDNVIYVGNAAGKIKAFDIITGTVKWSTLKTSSTRNFISEPIVVGGRVYVSNESGLLRF